jgi:integrase/recombinase XerD
VPRFSFKVTRDRPEITRHLVFVYKPRKLSRVLSPEEVLRFLEAVPSPKHKAALSVAYGAGLPSGTRGIAAGRRPAPSPS